MLTTTYSLIAISTEQKTVRNILSSLQQQIRSIVINLQSINQSCLEAALHKLEQFEEFCHRRKVETYVIPAIRNTTHEADGILSELETLSSNAVTILHSMQAQLQRAFEQGIHELNKLCSAMDLYCSNLLSRLVKEEEELFPMVRRLLPMEAWFQLASQFLSEETDKTTKSIKPVALLANLNKESPS